MADKKKGPKGLDWFREDVLARLAQLAPVEDVRIVFAFDN